MTDPKSNASSGHSAEMSKRRTTAQERTDAGPVFGPEYKASDGSYAWVVVLPQLFAEVLGHVAWQSDSAPGVRSDRVRLGQDRRSVIFRIRGMGPEQLAGAVSDGRVLAAEFWPNDRSDRYSGVNLVDPGHWRQDLLPATDRVFSLGLENNTLVLTRIHGVRPPVSPTKPH